MNAQQKGVWAVRSSAESCWRGWRKRRGLIISVWSVTRAGAESGRIVVDGLRRSGWVKEEWRRRAKGDGEKMKLVRELRERTTMTLA